VRCGNAPPASASGRRASTAPTSGRDPLRGRRATARAERDFATSDALRDELAGLGVEVRDTPTARRPPFAASGWVSVHTCLGVRRVLARGGCRIFGPGRAVPVDRRARLSGSAIAELDLDVRALMWRQMSGHRAVDLWMSAYPARRLGRHGEGPRRRLGPSRDDG